MNYVTPAANPSIVLRSFFNRTFSWMTAGLALTAIMAWFAANNEGVYEFVRSSYFMLFLVELGLVFVISGMVHRLNPSVSGMLFVLYAVLNGLTLSGIFFRYDMGAITAAFVTASAMFGTMAVLGYTTKTDLSKMGSIMFMALIGLLVAMLVNFFLQNSILSYAISLVGVVIFCALTAYDMQKLKEMALYGNAETGGTLMQTNAGENMAISGALALYLDFINIFLFLLRLFSGNRN